MQTQSQYHSEIRRSAFTTEERCRKSANESGVALAHVAVRTVRHFPRRHQSGVDDPSPPSNNFAARVVIVLHRRPGHESLLPSILSRETSMPVVEAVQGARLKPATVYIARADRHLTVTASGRFAYRDGHRIHHLLSSANPEYFGMPRSAINSGAVDYVLPLDEIAPALVRIVDARTQQAHESHPS